MRERERERVKVDILFSKPEKKCPFKQLSEARGWMSENRARPHCFHVNTHTHTQTDTQTDKQTDKQTSVSK